MLDLERFSYVLSMDPASESVHCSASGEVHDFIPGPTKGTNTPMSLCDNILEKLSTKQPWSPQDEKVVMDPYTYTVSKPGKDIRRKLIEAFNLWMNVPADKLEHIIDIVNMLHNASLLLDDIEDGSELRRGQPAAHKVYGVLRTINAANCVCTKACHEVAKLVPGEHDLWDMLVGDLMALIRGQGLEIYWRDSLVCPTEEQYVEMVNNKTSGLLRIGMRLMMACATTHKDVDFVPLVNLIGVYFQIRDDLMNLDSSEYTKAKGFAEDLSEGKFSFPIVHGIQADPSNTHLIDVLRKRPTDLTPKINAIDYLRHQTKSFEYTRSVMRSLETQTLDEIRRLGGNPGLDEVMSLLQIAELQSRTYEDK